MSSCVCCLVLIRQMSMYKTVMGRRLYGVRQYKAIKQ